MQCIFSLDFHTISKHITKGFRNDVKLSGQLSLIKLLQYRTQHSENVAPGCQLVLYSVREMSREKDRGHDIARESLSPAPHFRKAVML